MQHYDKKAVEFDWSSLSASTIQSAAFYSDCEQQIRQITRGYRVTLVYKLYVTEPIESTIVHRDPIIEPQSLPQYNYAKELLAQPAVFEECEFDTHIYRYDVLRLISKKIAGIMGIYCAHAYPHNTPYAKELLSRALKGSDMAILAVLKALNVDHEVQPVIYNHGYDPDDTSAFVGEDLHSIIDVHSHDVRSSIRRMIEQNWPSSADDEDIVWVNDPLHTNPALKVIAHSWRDKIMTLDSAVAVLAGIFGWNERTSKDEC